MGDSVMKFLFSSSSLDVVEDIGKRIKNAGIDCELRYPYVVDDGEMHWYPELWIREGVQYRGRFGSNSGAKFFRRLRQLGPLCRKPSNPDAKIGLEIGRASCRERV